jgi:hypothetical protein
MFSGLLFSATFGCGRISIFAKCVSGDCEDEIESSISGEPCSEYASEWELEIEAMSE